MSQTVLPERLDLLVEAFLLFPVSRGKITRMVANILSDILKRLLRPENGDLPPEVARYLLGLHLDQYDRDRMETLGVKANRGTLTVDEARELDSYLDVSLSLDILRAKARLSLKSQSMSAA